MYELSNLFVIKDMCDLILNDQLNLEALKKSATGILTILKKNEI